MTSRCRNPEFGKVAPYGNRVIDDNTGFANPGTDHDTGSFAAESIRRWWMRVGGKDLHPLAPAERRSTAAEIRQRNPDQRTIELDGFEIGAGDMRRIIEMNYAGGSGFDPDAVDF